jgi:hypothetical protein
LLISVPGANAETVLKSLKDNHVPVQLSMPVSSTRSEAGMPLALTVTESVFYKNQILPANTRLMGHVEEVKQARRLGRPAFVRVTVDTICLPGLAQCQLLPENKQFHWEYSNPGEKRIKGIVGHQMPASIAPWAVAIPLGMAASLAYWQIALIEQGASAVVGMTKEAIKPENPQMSMPKRLGYGALRSTSLPFLYQMSKKGKEFNLEPGQTVSVSLHPKLLEAAFEAVQTHPLPAQEDFSLPALQEGGADSASPPDTLHNIP